MCVDAVISCSRKRLAGTKPLNHLSPSTNSRPRPQPEGWSSPNRELPSPSLSRKKMGSGVVPSEAQRLTEFHRLAVSLQPSKPILDRSCAAKLSSPDSCMTAKVCTSTMESHGKMAPFYGPFYHFTIHGDLPSTDQIWSTNIKGWSMMIFCGFQDNHLQQTGDLSLPCFDYRRLQQITATTCGSRGSNYSKIIQSHQCDCQTVSPLWIQNMNNLPFQQITPYESVWYSMHPYVLRCFID